MVELNYIFLWKVVTLVINSYSKTIDMFMKYLCGSGGGRRGTTGRQELKGRKEGLHRPSGGLGTGGGATQAVGGSGGGRRGYTGRQGFRGLEEGLHRPSGVHICTIFT